MNTRWLRGLRPRYVLACVAVALVSGGLSLWASVAAASAALLASTEQRAADELAVRLEDFAPRLTFPPDADALDALRSVAGDDSVVVFGGQEVAGGAVGSLVTPRLRAETARARTVLVERIVSGRRAWLLVGTPVMLTSLDGSRRPSGIQVYRAQDLSTVQEEIDALTRSALLTAALSLPVAIALALALARSVLRPVRELRDTARRLAAGELDARSPVDGSDEVAELTSAINELAAAVERSVTTMAAVEADARRFAADVSHELRTPLSTLTAVTEVLSATADRSDPDARESAELAIAETRRLVVLVEDLMEVSRFDAGTATLIVDDVDLVDAVRSSLLARGWLGEGPPRIVELVVRDSPRLRLDRRRIDVITGNLVGNALRHGAPPVVVTVSCDESAASIEVVDHGTGIAEQLRAHVFDRFSKGDAARGRTAGSGLGLALARENARLHGGDIVARTAAGGGARFIVTLPHHCTREREVDTR